MSSGDAKVVRILHGMFLHAVTADASVPQAEKDRAKKVFEAVTLAAGETPIRYESLFDDRVLVPGVREFETADVSLPAHFLGPLVPLRAPGAGDPRVAYVTLGTGNGQKQLLEEVVRICASRFEKLYVSAGHIEGIEGKNVDARRFYEGIPEDAGVVVCHGGHGTVYQAMHAGKRMVVVPLNLDQVGQAYNAERCEVGVAVPYRMQGMLAIPDMSSLELALERVAKEAPRKMRMRVNDVGAFVRCIEHELPLRA